MRSAQFSPSAVVAERRARGSAVAGRAPEACSAVSCASLRGRQRKVHEVGGFALTAA